MRKPAFLDNHRQVWPAPTAHLTVVILAFSVISAASVGLLLAPAGLLLAFALATVEPAH